MKQIFVLASRILFKLDSKSFIIIHLGSLFLNFEEMCGSLRLGVVRILRFKRMSIYDQ